MEGFTNNYLANYYLYVGRAEYLKLVRGVYSSFISDRRRQANYFTNGRLKIHGIVETDVEGFKRASNGFFDDFTSKLRIAWAMQSSLVLVCS